MKRGEENDQKAKSYSMGLLIMLAKTQEEAMDGMDTPTRQIFHVMGRFRSNERKEKEEKEKEKKRKKKREKGTISSFQ